MITLSGLIIAVDFDGTIVKDAYPGIGKEMLFAFHTLRSLQQRGHRLILWTYRQGGLLEEAVQFCKENGVTFFAVNKNYPEENEEDSLPRKLNADIFIDDRNIGGFIGWDKIWQIIYPDENNMTRPRKKRWW